MEFLFQKSTVVEIISDTVEKVDIYTNVIGFRLLPKSINRLPNWLIKPLDLSTDLKIQLNDLDASFVQLLELPVTDYVRTLTL